MSLYSRNSIIHLLMDFYVINISLNFTFSLAQFHLHFAHLLQPFSPRFAGLSVRL